MPDWRKLDDYEYTNKLNAHGWAWEFLRRDKRFLEDYEALKNDKLKDEFGNASVFFHKTKLLFRKGKYILKPPLENGESVADWVSKYIDDPEGRLFYTPQKYVASKWGLNHVIPNPEENACEFSKTKNSGKYQKTIIFEKPVPRIFYYFHQLEELPMHFETDEINGADCDGALKINDDRIIVEFSLDEKIKSQFDYLKGILEERQKKYSNTIKPQRKTLLRRLRVLDATLENPKVKKSDIQNEIYGENENATEAMTHDNDLRYLKIFENKTNYLNLARSKI